MDEATIAKIASAVQQAIEQSAKSGALADVVKSSWPGWLGIAFSVVLGFVVVLATAYLKKRGENYATKAALADLVTQNSEIVRAVEETKNELRKLQSDEDLALRHRLLQGPILREAVRLIVRFREIFRGEFESHYSKPWSSGALSTTNLELNKRDTCVYRMFRLLGAIHIYDHQVSGLQHHSARSLFEFTLIQKIEPTLASGHLPGNSVIWRDAVMEVGEMMTEQSDKWGALRPLNWFDFVALVQSKDSRGQFFDNCASRIAAFLRRPNLRLALFSLYLVDLVQDNTGEKTWEEFRNDLLRYIKDHGKRGEFSIYGQTTDGRNDWEVMDTAGGRVPQNNRSPHFDPASNSGYPEPGAACPNDAHPLAPAPNMPEEGPAETSNDSENGSRPWRRRGWCDALCARRRNRAWPDCHGRGLRARNLTAQSISRPRWNARSLQHGRKEMLNRWNQRATHSVAAEPGGSTATDSALDHFHVER